MDWEDLLMGGGVAVGFFVAVLLYQWLFHWRRIYRYMVILFNAFFWATVTGTADRLIFHTLPRGTMFYRVFLAIPVIYIGYALKEFIDRRTQNEPSAHHGQERQQEGMVQS